jgi:hypothetical protein
MHIVALLRQSMLLIRICAMCLFVVAISCSNRVDDYQADFEEARRAAIDGWEQVIGPVSNECYRDTKQYIIVELHKMVECGSKPVSKGFHRSGCCEPLKHQIDVLITEDEYEKMDIVVHEFIHALDWCINHRADSGHDDISLWIPWGDNTVEAAARAAIFY